MNDQKVRSDENFAQKNEIMGDSSTKTPPPRISLRSLSSLRLTKQKPAEPIFAASCVSCGQHQMSFYGLFMPIFNPQRAHVSATDSIFYPLYYQLSLPITRHSAFFPNQRGQSRNLVIHHPAFFFLHK
jgi:hypothetical protein